MDSKLASFLKEMRSMDYADEKLAKNPPPNGITAAEIEAISTKTYDSSEQQETHRASEAPPTGGVTYWQALVDPNTNLTYYWNSQTNEVSWTLPEGGVITLPAASEQVEAKEKELEAAMESYPYSATIAAEFIKPVTTTTTTTTATATTDNGTSSPLPKSGTKRPQSSPGKRLESEVAPSVKKSRLNYDDQSSPTTTSSAEDKPSVVSASQALPEERMKAQVNNMVALLSKKLQSLQSASPNSSQLETLAIQLQTRQADWNEGGVTTKYMLEKLRKMNEDIFMFESSLLAGDQGLISDNESTAVSAEAGTGELSVDSQVPGPHESEQQPGLLVSQQPGPLAEEETTAVDPQPADREGAVSQSTGEMECSGSSAAVYSRVSFTQDFPEEPAVAAGSPGPCPPEVVGPSLSAASGVTSEAKVEPETGMPEGELAHREEEEEEMDGEAAGRNWREAAQGWRSWRGEGLEEKELRESNTRGKEKTDTYGVEDVARDVNSERNDSRDKLDYDRMVEDVTDKEDDENSSDDNHKSSSVAQPQAELKEEGVSSEEEGVWVEPGKERSEGELLDDSSDSSDDDTSSEDRQQDDRKKFGPREESSGKKKQVENYEKSEGELDQDSEDEKSEGELDDDKEEVWAERTDYHADRGSHSHRRQNYRPQVAHDQDSDYSDYSSSRRDRRDHRHYDSDYSDDYYSSRKSRHYRREHKNYNRSRDRYRDDSDYSDEYYTSSHRHDRGGRYDDGYEHEYYNKRSHYGSKSSSRSGKGYSGGGGGGSSSRYQRSRRSYDSDNERDHDRHRHHSSSKHRKRDKDKDRKKKLDRWGSSQNKDSEGDEKKPAASVLIGKVGKISTVRPLGKEKKAEEGADASKTGESTASATTSVPPGGAAAGVPPPMPPTTEMPAYQPMSATYYQHPSTGEVPYYPTYGTAYHQYPAYSAAQTYQQPPPPPPEQDEVREEEQKQQQEEGGWVWITNADGTPQWVRADSAAAVSAKQKDDDAKEKKKQEEDNSLESQQKKWGEVNPAQWGGADPVQWASMRAAAPPLPPEEPIPEEPKPKEPSPEEPRPGEPRPPATELDEETSAVAGEERMCSSNLMGKEQQQQSSATTDELPVAPEGQPTQSLETTEGTQIEGVISDRSDVNQLGGASLSDRSDVNQLGGASLSDRSDVNQLGGASFSSEAPLPEFVGEESSQVPPLPPSEPDVTDGEQKAEEEIADCEMEIESNHGSPVASEQSTVPPLSSDVAGDSSTSGQADSGLPAESKVSNALPAESLPATSSSQQTEGLNPSVPTNPMPLSASTELATTSTEAAQGDPSHVPVAATAVESSTEPPTQVSVAPSVTSSAAVVTQAASVASSSAVYYPSTAAAAPPPPVDAASYSYAAAYGQPAYNYAYAQSYNYAYMQPTAYGAYGMQAGAPAYYPYPTPAAGVYGTYPPTYYAATTYSSVPPPPTYQPPMSTVGAATSGVDNTTQLAKSGAKEKSTKSMLEQWTAFKEGQGKS